MATLITGLGYIGSALADRLLSEGEHVIGVESFFSTSHASLEPLLDRGLRLVNGNIAERGVLDEAFGAVRVDTLFHLAGQASTDPTAAPLSIIQETNFTGPRALLDACLHWQPRRVILASSMRLYRLPLPRQIHEGSPIEPTDLVHLSHLYTELLFRSAGLLGNHAHSRTAPPTGTLPSKGAADHSPTTATAARLAIVHGLSPVMKIDPRFLAVVSRFCLQASRGEPLTATTGLSSVLAFVHLEDAVEALLRCRGLRPSIGVVNVAAEVRSIASVARAVRSAGQAAGLGVNVRFTGPTRAYAPRTVCSALDASGFRPHRRVEDSVSEVLAHYSRDHPKGSGP